MPDTSNVSLGKPKITGSVFRASLPLGTGTSLPTDATTALASAFKELGYAADSGLTNSNASDQTEVKAWGGVVVISQSSGGKDTFKVKLIEVKNVETLKAVYGSSNVSGTLSTGITVKKNASEPEEGAWVFDMILKGNVAKRIVIPKGTIIEMADITYTDSDATGYEITISAEADADGNTHYEYIKSAA